MPPEQPSCRAPRRGGPIGARRKLFLHQLVQSRSPERCTDQIVAHHLAYVDCVESRNRNGRAKGCGFALEPFVASHTVGGGRSSGKDRGPGRNRARRQNAPCPRRGVRVLEESLLLFS